MILVILGSPERQVQMSLHALNRYRGLVKTLQKGNRRVRVPVGEHKEQHVFPSVCLEVSTLDQLSWSGTL